jgi:hypothetical protein
MGGTISQEEDHSKDIQLLIQFYGARDNDERFINLASIYMGMLDLNVQSLLARKTAIDPPVQEVLASGHKTILLIREQLKLSKELELSGVGAGYEKMNISKPKDKWTNRDYRAKIMEFEIRIFYLARYFKDQIKSYRLRGDDIDVKTKAEAIARLNELNDLRVEYYHHLGVENVEPPPTNEILIEQMTNKTLAEIDTFIMYYKYLTKEELQGVVTRLHKRIQLIKEYIKSKGESKLDYGDESVFPFEFIDGYNYDAQIAKLQSAMESAISVSSGGAVVNDDVEIISSDEEEAGPSKPVEPRSFNRIYASLEITLVSKTQKEKLKVNVKFARKMLFDKMSKNYFVELFPRLSEYVKSAKENFDVDRSSQIKLRGFDDIRPNEKGYPNVIIVVNSMNSIELATRPRNVLLTLKTKDNKGKGKAQLTLASFDSEEELEISRENNFAEFTNGQNIFDVQYN